MIGEVEPHNVILKEYAMQTSIPLEVIYGNLADIMATSVASIALKQCGIGADLSTQVGLLSVNKEAGDYLASSIPDSLRLPVRTVYHNTGGRGAFVMITPNQPYSVANYGLCRYSSIEHGSGTLAWNPKGVTIATEENADLSDIYDQMDEIRAIDEESRTMKYPMLPDALSEEFIRYAYGTKASGETPLSKKVLRAVIRSGLHNIVSATSDFSDIPKDDETTMYQDPLGVSPLEWLDTRINNFVRLVYSSREVAQTGLTGNLLSFTTSANGNSRLIWLVQNGEDCKVGNVSGAIGTLGQAKSSPEEKAIYHTALSPGPRIVESIYAGVKSIPEGVLTPQSHASDAFASLHEVHEPEIPFFDNPSYRAEFQTWTPRTFPDPALGIPHLRFIQSVSGIVPAITTEI